MRLSNLADYAVVLLAAAARAGPARLNATVLAAKSGVPLPTAQKLVGRLSAAGLLASSRGTGGGVRLARSPHAITLADIVEAVEGPIALTTCVDHARHDCALDHHCQVKPHWGAVNDALKRALDGVTLAELASPLPLAGEAGPTPSSPLPPAGGVGGGSATPQTIDPLAAAFPNPDPSRTREGRMSTPSRDRAGSRMLA